MESILYIAANGTKYWETSTGHYHRENDLPAIEYSDGEKAWYINGNLHRESGPARIKSNGTEMWILNNHSYKMPEEMPISLFISYCKWELNKTWKKQ